jgi:hypothetical protein
LNDVFILAYFDVYGDLFELVLLGTAFSITRRHVITTYHNIVDDKNCRLSEVFVIGKVVNNNNGNYTMDAPIKVRVVFGDASEDFVFLQIVDEAITFDSYLQLCPVDQLPDRDINYSNEIKTYHAPIGMFCHNSLSSLQIWSDDYKRVLQYDRDGKSIIVDGALYRGSCGCPYIDHDGLVVTMHVASINEGENISSVKTKVGKKRKQVIIVMDDWQSLSVYDLHASVRRGIVLPKILKGCQRFYRC